MDVIKNFCGRKISNAVSQTLCLLAIALAIAAPTHLKAQTAGEGTLAGTVTDGTGAVVPNAKVIATNLATNVSTERTSSSAGIFTIAPLPPGTYSLSVQANGFRSLKQDNLIVNALGVLNVNTVLTIGETNETVVVTAAPPVLDTSNATVGLVMENTTYANLPLQLNNSQRDATAFASLAPGAQAGTRVPIVGGTGNYLGQLYIDGMPAETINQQGDNRIVSQGINLDAVDQFQVVTSTPPAEYSGAGALNFTVKSGGNKYHGQAAYFVRNTAFDTWGFTQKWVQQPGINPATGVAYPVCSPVATTSTVAGQTITNAPRAGCQAKGAEHQGEISATFGGHVPHTGNKVFFFVAYDKFHSRRAANPALFTIPTPLMIQGDFTELNGGAGAGGLSGTGPDNKPLIYDPTSNACVGNSCTRTAFQGLKNGIPTNNVIPASYLSPITTKMASFMPAPSNPGSLTNNYLGGYPSGFDNNVQNWRVDWDINSKQRLSTVGAMGAVHYLQNYVSGGTGSGAYGFLPIPYVAGTVANIFPKFYDAEYTYVIKNNLVNQAKYSYTRFIQPQTAATDGKTQYAPAAFGITNVPAGAASTNFPGASFGQTGAASTTLTGWTQQGSAGSTQSVIPETYAALDNLQWTKGKHAITVGFTYEWQQTNVAAPVGPSGLVELPFNSNSTADYAINPATGLHTNAINTTTSGISFASYLLGAVGGSPSLALQPVSELGGRYRLAAPYASDNWKINSKLTVDLGLRWDYFSPYHEVKDRWSFLNPTLTNPATGTPGLLQFAGNRGSGVSCNCRTPVQTYWKNWGPRIGLVYAVDDKTVFRVGAARVFSQAGGVGGRGGAYQGTGQTGFNINANATPESTTGINAGPSFYLNNGSTFTSKGIANTDLLGKGFVYPSAPAQNAAAQLLQTGNYLNGAALATASGVSYADFYLSGRAPEFTFFNVGMERSITKDMTVSVNYVGDQSHFLNTGANARGYWSNQLNPVYLAALGGVTDSTGTKPILIAAATSANVAKAQASFSGLVIPTFFQNAANANPNSSVLTLAQGLTAFPQYSAVTDLWGANSANLSYHSFQLAVQQRTAHGLSFNINYTYSKNIGDDGTFRSGFDIPAAAISGGGQSWKQDRIERSWSVVSAPQVVHAFGVYQLPFGKNKMGGDSMLVRSLAGGWTISGIYTYGSGIPIPVISSVCTANTSPLQGQCMPDVVPGATNARINGSYGTGPNGTSACNLGIGPNCTTPVKYLDANQFKTAANVSPTTPIYLLGNAPRTAPLTLRGPGNQDLDAALRRSFNLPKEFGTFVFEVDCINVWNKVVFNSPVSTYGASNFGQITGVASSPGSRDFQFAGHFNF
jgi:Carboxypeptidase regulatory-like domain/TonB dependent receptor